MSENSESNEKAQAILEIINSIPEAKGKTVLRHGRWIKIQGKVAQFSRPKMAHF